MTTIDKYLNLVTSEFRQQPNFIATLSANESAPVRVQDVLSSMIPLFDIDVAVGDQLDIIGKWVGVSRNVAIPIAGIYFSWNDIDADGWDFGSWAPLGIPTSITTLPDDTYRTLLRARIGSNKWDGTTDSAYVIWDALLPGILVLIQDNQDMTYDLAIIGPITSLQLALITGGYIPLRPEGVLLRNVYNIPTLVPVFCWDVETSTLEGWDEGSWVIGG